MRPFFNEFLNMHSCRVDLRIRGGRTNLEAISRFLNHYRDVMALVEPSGFLDFLAIAPSRECHGALLKALAERWWDTTNTFHFPCGELTMTPTDLTLITGLRFGSRALDFYDDWRFLSSEVMVDLLGCDPPRDNICVPRSWFRGRIDTLGGLEGLMMEADQSARLAILVILGCSFLHTRRDTVNLNILRSLADLSTISEYDWGGAALGTMYREMSNLLRGVFHSLGGMHFAWEVCANSVLYIFSFCFPFTVVIFPDFSQAWAYDYLSVATPVLVQPRLDSFPVGCRWNSRYWVDARKMDFRTIRAFFSRLSAAQVCSFCVLLLFSFP